MILDLGSAILNIDKIRSVGINTIQTSKDVPVGKYFFDLFTKYETKKTITYNVQIDYIRDEAKGVFTLTEYDDFKQAKSMVDSIKKQLEDAGSKYIDEAFEKEIISGNNSNT